MTLCTCCVIRPAKHAPELQCRYIFIFFIYFFPQVCTLCPCCHRWWFRGELRLCNLIHQWAISDKQRATTCHCSKQTKMKLVTGMARAVPHKLSQFELCACVTVWAVTQPLCLCPSKLQKENFTRGNTHRENLKQNWKPFSWKMNSSQYLKSLPQTSESFVSLIREQCNAWISK